MTLRMDVRIRTVISTKAGQFTGHHAASGPPIGAVSHTEQPTAAQ
jgi:hypothetical protein